MIVKNKAAPGGSGALQELDGSGQQAVCTFEYTTFTPANSRLKTTLVTALQVLFESSPPLVMALGQLTLAYWPGFRED